MSAQTELLLKKLLVEWANTNELLTKLTPGTKEFNDTLDVRERLSSALSQELRSPISV